MKYGRIIRALLLFPLMTQASPAIAQGTHANPGAVSRAPAVAGITDTRAELILRRTCQYCHNNQRAAARRRGTGWQFNLEGAAIRDDFTMRERIRNAIVHQEMPFGGRFRDEVGVINGNFLGSDEGRALMAWLARRPAANR